MRNDEPDLKEEKRIISKYLEGVLSVANIGKMHGIGRIRILNILEKHNISRRDDKHKLGKRALK